MPAVQRSEFALALNQVATERGIDISVVLETVKNAILAAYRKDHPGIEVEEYTASLDSNTGEARIFHKEEDVTPPGFGRIAAQTAKQVILQKIREKEKEAIMSDYKVKVGSIVNGMILRFAHPNVIVDIGKTEAVMPPAEQISNEKYHLNQRLAIYLKEIKEGSRGEEIIVSRSSNGLLEGLFRREVPEIAQGSVVIKAIAREAGNRSKIAVFSSQQGIDPVGSCVGQKGVRVQAIIQEFGGLEKIDIIQWQELPKNYIAAALSPAKQVRVEVDEQKKEARVFVPRDELSLAIGKEGQNVRLASKLTGFRIEIEGEEELEEPEEAASNAAAAKGTDEKKEESSPAETSTQQVSGQAAQVPAKSDDSNVSVAQPNTDQPAGQPQQPQTDDASQEPVVQPSDQAAPADGQTTTTSQTDDTQKEDQKAEESVKQSKSE